MSSVNKVIVVGNLGAKPKSGTTKSGTTWCRLSIATNERYKDKSGEWKERTEWHQVVLWGKMAENAARYLSKGRQVYVEGRLQTRKWEDEAGNTRYSTDIVAREVVYLGGAPGRPTQSDGPPDPTDEDVPAQAEADNDEFSDDEMPF